MTVTSTRSAGLFFFMDVSGEMRYPLMPLFLCYILGVNGLMKEKNPSTLYGYSVQWDVNDPQTTFFWDIDCNIASILFLVFFGRCKT